MATDSTLDDDWVNISPNGYSKLPTLTSSIASGKEITFKTDDGDAQHGFQLCFDIVTESPTHLPTRAPTKKPTMTPTTPNPTQKPSNLPTIEEKVLPTIEEKVCCEAEIASCLACKEDISREEFCSKENNKNIVGCYELDKECQANCKLWYNGCNNCSCSKDGLTKNCTEKFCIDDYESAFCLDGVYTTAKIQTAGYGDTASNTDSDLNKLLPDINPITIKVYPKNELSYSGSSKAYYVSHEGTDYERPELQMKKNEEYTLIVNENEGHPIGFYKDEEKNEEYFLPTETGTIIHSFNCSAPDILYYQCQTHEKMGWKIKLSNEKCTTPEPENRFDKTRDEIEKEEEKTEDGWFSISQEGRVAIMVITPIIFIILVAVIYKYCIKKSKNSYSSASYTELKIGSLSF